MPSDPVLSLMVGFCRTPDMTLKRHIRFLGFALGSFVLALVIFSVGPYDAVTIAGDVLTTVATYVLFFQRCHSRSWATWRRGQRGIHAASRFGNSSGTAPSDMTERFVIQVSDEARP